MRMNTHSKAMNMLIMAMTMQQGWQVVQGPALAAAQWHVQQVQLG
jgi:hypothetical protein